MNHIYCSVWNESTGTVTAVSEHAKRGGKKPSSRKNAVVRPGFVLQTLSTALALTWGAAPHASPAGGTVVAGTVSISTGDGTTTIQQTSQNASLTWQGFDIGATEAVRFIQPNANSIALNRVLGADPSTILGSLSANGKVFLINPNGILFGTGAQVNVGGLIASTRDITDSDFVAGRYLFSGDSTGGIVNLGSIRADGGYVALLGATVSNEGVIAARLGSVALASGNVLTLDVAGDGLLNVTVDAGAVDALVQNGGLIQADGGQIMMTARSASTLLQSAVNNTGVIQAQTVENRSGTIRLLGDMQSGDVNVAGTLDASAPAGGDGGFIDTSAAHVNIASEVQVTTAAQGLTGSWLIDPTDYTIAASGGNITGAALSSSLASTNVTILSSAGNSGTAGNVNVNDTVTWSANTLTLNARNNINVNTAMNGSGTASLALVYGQGAVATGNTSRVNVNAPVNLPAGNHFSTLLGSNGSVVNYTVITSLGAAGSMTGTDLQGIAGNLAGRYVLGSNIDAAVTSTWNAGAGFTPIGTDPSRFTGIFDGLGHTVSGVYINRTGSNFTGMFGYTAAGSMIRNTGLIGGSVTSDSWSTGSLIGALSGTVMNSYATGTVRGYQTAGGLVGVIDGGAVIGSYATGDVVAYGTGGSGEAGGLVGLSWGAGGGTVDSSYATGNASSALGNVGGLMAINWGTITNSHATGSTSGTDYVGGLVGNNSNGSVSNSYATGTATGRNYVGGLVGNNSNTLSNNYATGAVTGNDHVGGLAGNFNGTATNNYATGSVTGHDFVGGLVGYNNYGTLTGNHASGVVHGNDNVGGLLGHNYAGTLTGNFATSAVFGRYSVGGLLGRNYGGSYGYGTLDNNYASGNVSGGSFVGGLVGTNRGDLTDNHATGSVTGDDQIGGLVGGNQSGSIGNSYASGAVVAYTGAAGGLVGYSSAPISNSHASGAVSGVYQVGGLLGAMNGSSIANSYATGAASGTGNVGGLVGNSSNGTITTAYSTGVVTGTTDRGGLLGSRVGATVTNSYWDTTTSGMPTSAGGIGLTTTQMQNPASFAGFNLTTTPGATGNNWVMVGFDGSLNSGANATRPMLASEYSTSIANAHQLQLMIMNLGASYTLAQNIDASATATANDVWSGSSFVPVGKENARFTGSLNGLGHTIDALHINLPPSNYANLALTSDQAGLFGDIGSAGSVQNVGLTNVSVAGRDFAGALAGQSAGAVTNSYATGTVQGRSFVGGLVAHNNGGSVTGSHSSAAVTATGGSVGGLVGYNQGAFSSNYATGAVQGADQRIGGLVGFTDQPISNSYASGSVTGVGAGSYVGGLVGRAEGDVSNSYATGAVQGLSYVGGLLGTSYGTVTNTYSTGLVQGTNSVGGLMGLNYGSVSRSFWNTEASGQAFSAGGSGLTAAEMTQLASYSSWNTATPNTIANTGNSGASWRIYEGQTAPLFTTYLTPLTLTDNVVVTYNSTVQSGMNVVPVGVLGTTATNAGVHTFYSSQQGYDLTGGTLTIKRANLVLNGTRSYDGTTAMAGSHLTAVGVAGESFALTGSGDASNLASGNVQAGSLLATTTGLALGAGSNGGMASNYNALGTTGSSISITAAALTLRSTDVIKTYDGTLTAAGTATVVSGTLFGDDDISGGIFAFTDANAGTGDKVVTAAGVAVSDGNGGANYSVSYTSNTTSTIDRAQLTVVGQAAEDKVYDGTTVATLRGGSLAGVIAGETLAITEAGTFATAEVGTAIPVTAANSIGDTGAANYVLVQPAGLSASITAVPIVVPPVVVTPPVPPVVVNLPAIVPPEVLPPSSVTESIRYLGAVGQAVSSSQLAKLADVSSPTFATDPDAVPAESRPAIVGAVRLETFDLAGLNLAIVDFGIRQPALRQGNPEEETQLMRSQ